MREGEERGRGERDEGGEMREGEERGRGERDEGGR